MNKFTLAALAVVAVAGSATAQVRWNPEGAWTSDQGVTTLPVSEDGKYVINKLGKMDNGNWRNDIRYAKEVKLIESEPYLVFQITQKDCSWKDWDFKFEFMLQRKVSEGLNEEGAVVWGGNTESTHKEYPSFDGSKLRVFDEWGADMYTLLGGSIVDGENNEIYTDDIFVIDLNKVRATDEEKTQGLLFQAGDVVMPNYNAFQNIVEPDEAGMGGVQQRSWLGFVCIAPGATVTSDEPAFEIRYAGTVADSSDALTVCENYANGEGGQEVRDGDGDAVKAVASDDVKVYLKNGKTVVADGASIEAYTVDGKLAKNGFDTLNLTNGLYVIKAVKNGNVATVKAVVK